MKQAGEVSFWELPPADFFVIVRDYRANSEDNFEDDNKPAGLPVPLTRSRAERDGGMRGAAQGGLPLQNNTSPYHLFSGERGR